MDKTREVQIVIHVNDALSDEHQEDLLRALKSQDGIINACFSPGRRHLALVDYDASRIHSWNVLEYVRRKHGGAVLIGGV